MNFDVDRLARPFVERLAAYEPHVERLSRVGLGTVILFAGVHKLVDPGAWAVYVVPWFAALLPTTPVEFMLLNGVLEPPFALALFVDRYTTFAAAFVAASLAATVAYLTLVAATTGLFVDVLVRDVGLVALAVSVAIRSAAGRDD